MSSTSVSRWRKRGRQQLDDELAEIRGAHELLGAASEPQHLRQHAGGDLGVVVQRDRSTGGRPDRDAQEARVRELHPEPVDALVERGLRRCVVHHARVRAADAVGPEVRDDAAGVEPRRGAGEQHQRADGVGREHVVEGLGRRLVHGHQRRDPAGEHHEVEAAERADGLVEDPGAVGRLADVAGHDHAPAGLLDRVLELVAAAGAEHDPASGLDRLGGDAAADPGRGADDQHPCARQIRRHRYLPRAPR